jgi:hypothetical protein
VRRPGLSLIASVAMLIEQGPPGSRGVVRRLTHVTALGLVTQTVCSHPFRVNCEFCVDGESQNRQFS